MNTTDAIIFVTVFFMPVEGFVDCFEALDANDNGFISLMDAVYAYIYLFHGGPPPPAPFPTCGEDDDGDRVNCNGGNVNCP